MAITYHEKGIGLHQAIVAAGHWLAQIDGVWRSDNYAAVQSIIDAYTLDQAKAHKSKEVTLHAKSLRDKVVAAISSGELSSWPVKLSEAAKFAGGADAAQCPMLAGEALARGITLSELVGKVDGNAAGFSALESAIGGTDGKHRDAIKALTTFAEVCSYDFSAGWPAV